jgi:hypothetical protein
VALADPDCFVGILALAPFINFWTIENTAQERSL